MIFYNFEIRKYEIHSIEPRFYAELQFALRVNRTSHSWQRPQRNKSIRRKNYSMGAQTMAKAITRRIATTGHHARNGRRANS